MSLVKVANAPCSWGVLEDVDDKEAALTYERVLDEMSEAGYAGTELGDWGFMPTERDTLKQALSARNLEMLAAFVPVDLKEEERHAEGAERAVRTAALIRGVSQAPFIVLSDENCKNLERTKNAGRIKPSHQLSPSQWQTFTQGAELVARRVLEETGVKTVFHHHCAGFIETPYEIERFLELTNPLVLGLCLDTGHYMLGGGDPLEAIDKYRERIWHVHFKDVDAQKRAEAERLSYDYIQSVRSGVFCELGKGQVRFPEIVARLKAQNYSGWIVVEQDVLPGMGAPKESALRSRRYLKELGV